jgi:hypothetical protein
MLFNSQHMPIYVSVPLEPGIPIPIGMFLYELAKILGHSNIKMTERYAKPGRAHMAKTSNTAREI